MFYQCKLALTLLRLYLTILCYRMPLLNVFISVKITTVPLFNLSNLLYKSCFISVRGLTTVPLFDLSYQVHSQCFLCNRFMPLFHLVKQTCGMFI